MALQLWETIKESITAYTGLSPATFFTVLALGLTLYYVVSNLFGSSDDAHIQQGSRGFEEQREPLPPPVQVGEITAEELKQYDGSDPKKPLLMAIKCQIYDVSQSRMFYGPGGPYALFAGKDASRALAKMSFEDKDLNGDLTGLGVFELEALQDWEYKFMSKYVKVGTVKTVPATEGSTEGQATETSENDASKSAEAAEGDAAKPAEDGPSERVPRGIDESEGDAAKLAKDGPSESVPRGIDESEGNAAKLAKDGPSESFSRGIDEREGDSAKSAEDGPLESVPRGIDETTTAAVDPEKKE